MKITIKVARDSVAMGDDCTAPNKREFDVDAHATLADFSYLIIRLGYLPSIQGGQATWILVFQKHLIAVFAQQWDGPKFLVDSDERLSNYLKMFEEEPNEHFWFNYKRQNDPEKTYQDLKL